MSDDVQEWLAREITVDKGSAVPFYQQLKDLLTQAIKRHALRPGARLPSERELCERFDVSRLTVRRALTDLINAGVVFTQPGKGTYIQTPKLEQGIQQLGGLTEDLRRRGYTVTSRVLQVALGPASVRTSDSMRLPVQAAVVLLERLRLVNDEPLAIERCYLNHRLCPGITAHDLTRSLYSILRQTYGLTISRAEQTYEAVSAGRREAELLGVSRGAPLLFSERRSFLDTGDVIEHGVAWYRGDRYKFHAVLLGSGPNLNIVLTHSTASVQPLS